METKINTENRLATMEAKLDNLIEDVKEISCDIKKLDTKYSAKWVESLVLVIAGGLIVTILGGLFFYLLK